MSRPLVILRPEPGAGASVAHAAKLGLKAIATPLFAVEPVEWGPVDAGRYAAIVATSANVFRHGGDRLRGLVDLPVHAVGEATAAAARAAGFRVAQTGRGGRDGLRLPDCRLLHLAGRDHLPVEGHVDTVIVYESRAIDPPPAIDHVRGAVVAVHSPRAGRRLCELVTDRSASMIAAISANAAIACGEGWERVAIAAAPEESALLALAARLCQNTAQT